MVKTFPTKATKWKLILKNTWPRKMILNQRNKRRARVIILIILAFWTSLWIGNMTLKRLVVDSGSNWLTSLAIG